MNTNTNSWSFGSTSNEILGYRAFHSRSPIPSDPHRPIADTSILDTCACATPCAPARLYLQKRNSLPPWRTDMSRPLAQSPSAQAFPHLDCTSKPKEKIPFTRHGPNRIEPPVPPLSHENSHITRTMKSRVKTIQRFLQQREATKSDNPDTPQKKSVSHIILLRTSCRQPHRAHGSALRPPESAPPNRQLLRLDSGASPRGSSFSFQPCFLAL